MSSSPGPSIEPFTPSLARLGSLENASFIRSSKNPIAIEDVVVVVLARVDDDEEAWNPSTHDKEQLRMNDIKMIGHGFALLRPQEGLQSNTSLLSMLVILR